MLGFLLQIYSAPPSGKNLNSRMNIPYNYVYIRSFIFLLQIGAQELYISM